MKAEPEIVIIYHTLSLTRNGEGTVEVNGTPTTPFPWSHDFLDNDLLVLEAIPDIGWLFDGWTGTSNPTYNPVAVLMDADRTIVANFVTDTADSDGDGMSNYDEAIAGTDPDDPDSLFQFSGIAGPSASTITISWPVVAGRTYSIYYSDDPVGPSMMWTLAQSNITASSTGTNTWTDDGSRTRLPAHFSPPPLLQTPSSPSNNALPPRQENSPGFQPQERSCDTTSFLPQPACPTPIVLGIRGASHFLRRECFLAGFTAFAAAFISIPSAFSITLVRSCSRYGFWMKCAPSSSM